MVLSNQVGDTKHGWISESQVECVFKNVGCGVVNELDGHTRTMISKLVLSGRDLYVQILTKMILYI